MNSNNLFFNNKEFLPDWKTNWGDNIAHHLISNILDYDIPIEILFWASKGMVRNGKLVSIGSVMDHVLPEDLVWGTGIIDQGRVKYRPKKVYAVRGPLTRHELISRGIPTPTIYGDPALLIPKIDNLEFKKEYEWGIIPHYIEFQDKNSLNAIKKLELLGCKIIDICQPHESFLKELASVEKVLSSSLHGLIISDAYEIPNARINFSNKLIGSHFKFIDYCMSVHRKIDYGFQITDSVNINVLENIPLNDKITIDLQRLLESAPWNSKEWKDLMLSINKIK